MTFDDEDYETFDDDARGSLDLSLRSIDDRVVIVGMGPCGLFAALALTEQGVPVTVIERGQPVEARGRDIGALFARRVLNEDSNLCYGEGGAGTWSDGKLTTRIGRNGDDVRSVLRDLVRVRRARRYTRRGEAALRTDRLVRILRNAREYLIAPREIRFRTRLVEAVALPLSLFPLGSARTRRVVTCSRRRTTESFRRRRQRRAMIPLRS